MNSSPDTLSTQLQQLAEYDTALLANLLNFVDSTPTHPLYMSNEETRTARRDFAETWIKGLHGERTSGRQIMIAHVPTRATAGHVHQSHFKSFPVQVDEQFHTV